MKINNKPAWLERNWTREEQSIIAADSKQGMVRLGMAVLRQWKRDGKPDKSKDGIMPWLAIVQDSLREKDDKSRKQEVSNFL